MPVYRVIVTDSHTDVYEIKADSADAARGLIQDLETASQMQPPWRSDLEALKIEQAASSWTIDDIMEVRGSDKR